MSQPWTIYYTYLRRAGRSSRGFTILELMIGVVIVGILVALAIPSHRGFLDKADLRIAIADIRELEGLIDLYRAEYGVYPSNLADVNQAGRLDPWGNAYEYFNVAGAGPGVAGRARKDRNLVPINSTYDLYSKGPDGDSQKSLRPKVSWDDVIRGRDGGYVGLASEY